MGRQAAQTTSGAGVGGVGVGSPTLSQSPEPSVGRTHLGWKRQGRRQYEQKRRVLPHAALSLPQHRRYVQRVNQMKKTARCFTQTGLKRPRSSAIPPCFPSAPGGRETGAGWTCLVSDKGWEGVCVCACFHIGKHTITGAILPLHCLIVLDILIIPLVDSKQASISLFFLAAYLRCAMAFFF